MPFSYKLEIKVQIFWGVLDSWSSLPWFPILGYRVQPFLIREYETVNTGECQMSSSKFLDISGLWVAGVNNNSFGWGVAKASTAN